MSLSPSEQDWVDLYLRHHRSSPSSIRVVRALHQALAAAEEPTARELAGTAEVDHTTAIRARARLVALGLIRLSRGAAIAGGGRERSRYETFWPPQPPPHR